MALLPALLYAAPHHVVIGASDCSTRQELEAEDGMPFTLVAEPRSNASFLRWSDGTTDNPYLLHITSDTTITAIFSAATPALTRTDTVYQDREVQIQLPPEHYIPRAVKSLAWTGVAAIAFLLFRLLWKAQNLLRR